MHPAHDCFFVFPHMILNHSNEPCCFDRVKDKMPRKWSFLTHYHVSSHWVNFQLHYVSSVKYQWGNLLEWEWTLNWGIPLPWYYTTERCSCSHMTDWLFFIIITDLFSTGDCRESSQSQNRRSGQEEISCPFWPHRLIFL